MFQRTVQHSRKMPSTIHIHPYAKNNWFIYINLLIMVILLVSHFPLFPKFISITREVITSSLKKKKNKKVQKC